MRILALVLVLVAAWGGGARAQTLTADLSSHIIGIQTGFTGDTLVLFGSTDKPGDIVVVVRGTPADLLVRRKEKIAGVWINGSRALFHDAPSFYAVAATRALGDITSAENLARHNIGLDNIRLPVVDPLSDEQLAVFRAALIENQQKDGLYRAAILPVTFMGDHLFRTDISFPANVPTGSYSVEVFLFSAGELVGAQTTPLIVSRVGFSNNVFVVAHHHAALYGAGALIFALAAGWAGGAAFRRV
jgi:uncharacterized protein (TIGR02186 family)